MVGVESPHEMVWMEATPPSAPVNPTYAVLPPTTDGMFTVQLVLAMPPVTVSLKVIVITVPL